jgi:hypothetical protein
MAKKTYRVNFGTHAIPNPKFDGGKEGSLSHVDVQAGETFEIDEERVKAFTSGPNPKISLVSEARPIEEIIDPTKPPVSQTPQPLVQKPVQPPQQQAKTVKAPGQA